MHLSSSLLLLCFWERYSTTVVMIMIVLCLLFIIRITVCVKKGKGRYCNISGELIMVLDLLLLLLSLLFISTHTKINWRSLQMVKLHVVTPNTLATIFSCIFIVAVWLVFILWFLSYAVSIDYGYMNFMISRVKYWQKPSFRLIYCLTIILCLLSLPIVFRFELIDIIICNLSEYQVTAGLFSTPTFYPGILADLCYEILWMVLIFL